MGGDALDYLHPLVVRLWHERGFKNPTPPQRKAVPLVAMGENVLIVAPTGTGKTEAAFLPILSRLLEEGEGGTKLLYVTPLRTLNRDILSRLEWWALKLDIRMAVRHGDTPVSERRIQALRPPDVVVTTPETLQLLLIGSRLREHLRSLKWIIIDEVHEIADSKRGVQLSLVLEKIKEFLGREPQIVGLSATVGNPEEIGRLLVGARSSCRVVYTPVAKRIEVKVVWPDITDDDYRLSDILIAGPAMASRLRFIREVLESHKSVLIFTNTRPTAEALGSRFRIWDEKIPVFVHHGSLSQSERIRIEEMLRSGRLKGVICTSSMELGIDIGYIDIVVQYNSPREVRRLVQRIGRAGHSLERTSKGIVVVGNSDDALESIVLVRRLKEELIEPSIIPGEPFDVLAHEVVGYSLKFRKTPEEMYEVFRNAEPYRELSFEDFRRVVDFLRDIGLVREGFDGTIRPADRRAFDYFFGVLSMIPEVRQYYVVDSSSREMLGLLDDFFVSEYCEVGARFVMGGRSWEVTGLGEDVVYVKPVADFESAIPSWVGEEIPVPYEVAVEVGRIRGWAGQLASQSKTLGEAAKAIAGAYGVEEKLVEKSIRSAFEMFTKGFPVPSDRLILVEETDGLVVVHSHFGNRVNRALGKYVAYRISRLYGAPVYISEKPYRMILRTEFVDVEEVAELLRTLTREKFLRHLRRSVEMSRAFRWRLQQVARRMGVVSSEARLTRGDVDRLVATLKDTPAYEEALKEVLERDLDIRNALKVVDMVARGEIKVSVAVGPSPLTQEHVSYLREFMEPFPPERRELLSILSFKSRILQSFASFACMDCGGIFELPVSEVTELTKCPYCGSDRLAFDTITEEEMASLYRRCAGGRGRGCRRLRMGSKLFEEHGEYAVYARAAGLSFTEISGLLKNYRKTDRERYFRDLWRATREKIRRSVLGPRNPSARR